MVVSEVNDQASSGALLRLDGDLVQRSFPQAAAAIAALGRTCGEVVVDSRSVTTPNDMQALRVLSDLTRYGTDRGFNVVSVVPAESLELMDTLVRLSVPVHVRPGVDRTRYLHREVLTMGTGRSAAPGFRPVEARVVNMLEGGLSASEIAFRFQRSTRWVSLVAQIAWSKLGSC